MTENEKLIIKTIREDRKAYRDTVLPLKLSHIAMNNIIAKEAWEEECSRLQSENAALRERLEKAVELPCNVGDTIYSVFEFPKEKTVLKGTCNHIDINICGGFPEIFTKCVFETNEMILPRIYSGKALNNIFLTKQEAEARLAELKGGGGK